MSAAVEPWRNPFEGWPTIPSKYLTPEWDPLPEHELKKWQLTHRVYGGDERPSGYLRALPPKDEREAQGAMELVCDRHGKHVRTLYRIGRGAQEGDAVAHWTARPTKWQGQLVGYFEWGAGRGAEVVHGSAKPTADEPLRKAANGQWARHEMLPAAITKVPITCKCGLRLMAPLVPLTIALETFYRAGVLSITVDTMAGALSRDLQPPAATNC